MRRRVFELLNHPRAGDTLGRIVSLALLALIAANVAANVLETDAEIAAYAPGFFRGFELVSVAVFTLEYVLRLWSAPEDPQYAGRGGRLRMALSAMALIDLAAFAPFYLSLLAPGTVDLRYLRVLRLLRVFRLLRSRRVSESFATLSRVIRGKHVELGVTVAVVAAAMLLSAGAMYMVEHQQPDTPFTSIPRTMWWAIVTITTIGYGDMVPSTPLGQVIGGLVGFLGVCALALPVGIVSSGFIEEIGRKAHRRPAGPGTPVGDGYELHAGAPTLDEYLELRRVSGLSLKTEDQARGALANSWTFCHVRETASGRAVAMGRTLGDGGWYFHIADMATDPAHQRRGLGAAVLAWLVAEIDANAPPGAYISLLADPAGQPLYRKGGFVPSESLGMVLRRRE